MEVVVHKIAVCVFKYLHSQKLLAMLVINKLQKSTRHLECCRSSSDNRLCKGDINLHTFLTHVAVGV